MSNSLLFQQQQHKHTIDYLTINVILSDNTDRQRQGDLVCQMETESVCSRIFMIAFVLKVGVYSHIETSLYKKSRKLTLSFSYVSVRSRECVSARAEH